MIFTQYKIVYYARNNSNDENTDLSLMSCQTSNGTNYAFMDDRFDVWKKQSLDGSNNLYALYMFEFTFDTDGSSAAVTMIKKWIKPTVPKATIKYNTYADEAAATIFVKKKTTWDDYPPPEPDHDEDSPEDHHEEYEEDES